MRIEFGEKLKKCREEKGITQQTLADKLYVTRQAVSRWECGARYPDLITAKHIAEELEISLDELVSGEKYIRDVEKEPVLTTPISMPIQTALYAIACIPYLLMCFFDMGVSIPYTMHFYGGIDSGTLLLTVRTVGSFINFLVMGTGLYYSVQNDLSPRCIGWIMSTRFYVAIVTTALLLYMMVPDLMRGARLSYRSSLGLLFSCVAPFILFGFFYAKKAVNVKYVYAVICVLVLFFLFDAGVFVRFVYQDITGMKEPDIANYLLDIVSSVGEFAYILLLAFQAYTLNKKRAAVNLQPRAE